MPRKIRDVKLRNSRPTRQERLDRDEEEDEGEEVTCNDEEFKGWTDDMGGRYCTYTKVSWNANVTDMCDTCPYNED